MKVLPKKVSFEWSHYRNSFTDLKVKTTLEVPIINSGRKLDAITKATMFKRFRSDAKVLPKNIFCPRIWQKISETNTEVEHFNTAIILDTLVGLKVIIVKYYSKNALTASFRSVNHKLSRTSRAPAGWCSPERWLSGL